MKLPLPSFAVLLSAVAFSGMAAAAPPPRVAVFFQPGFPFYLASPLTSPRTVVKDLRAAGVDADLLAAAALADPEQLNVEKYGAVILPYGNTYPQTAFANLRSFHGAGGALVLSGVPFTHGALPSAASWSAAPEWGEWARVVTDAFGGAQAVELKGNNGDWTGLSSPRLPARPGARLAVSGWLKDVSGADGGNDWLYARFFDGAGNFIGQSGAKLSPGAASQRVSAAAWHRVSAEITVPDKAATWDLSPQMRSAGRVLRLDDVEVRVGDAIVPLPNAGFELPGDEWSDAGHDSAPALFGPRGIGAGGFAGPAPDKERTAIAPGDPFGLAALRPEWPPVTVQWLDVKSLPAGTTVTPALLLGEKPLAVLFRVPGGAPVVWTQHPSHPDADGYWADQLFARGAVAALAEQGSLSPEQRQAAFAALDRLPRPALYADLELPQPRRPYATFQPKMPPPARELFVADMRPLSSDERRLLVSLQGIVNRRQPRVYLIFTNDDQFWLDEMQRQGHTDAPRLVKEPLSLVETFRGEVQGAVVPDPQIYDSPCVAASLAGADDLLIATPELAAKLNLPIKADLRGQFADNAAALRYLRTEVLPRLNPYLAICLDPVSLDNGAVDQIIAARGAVFWVTGHRAQNKPGADGPAELEEVKALLAKLPLNAVVRGFWWHGDGQGLDEGPGVSLGSRFGKVTIVSDGVANFSVFSGVPLETLRQKPRPAAPPLDKSKVYVALTMSDGDNLTTWRSYFRAYFTHPLHGTFPVGWGMGPTLLDTAPVWARWYYEHAAPGDEFICDVSGVGYIYPPDWAAALRDRAGAHQSFYDWTQKYMERMDMRALRVMNVDEDDVARVGQAMPKLPFLMPDYGYGGRRSYEQLTYTLPSGQSVFRAASYDGSPEKMAADIRAHAGTARPAFVNAFIWNWGAKMPDLKKTLDALGPEFVAVTPSQLDALYRQAKRP